MLYAMQSSYTGRIMGVFKRLLVAMKTRLNTTVVNITNQSVTKALL